MRLTSKEVKAIKNGFQSVCADIAFRLYLFGSRVDDTKKGGDIDLLVIVEHDLKDRVVANKSKIRSKIFELIPEQRIDITVATEEELLDDPFLLSLSDKIPL